MFDCIIIGCGPAGITAGIYLKRNNLNILILEKNIPGGAIVSTSVINNYPGYETIDGASLASNMYTQLLNLGVRAKREEAKYINKKENYFEIITNKNTYETKKVILSMGLIHKKLNFENEDQFINRGLSWCAICDGALYKNKNVSVVGGGNSALEESLYLSSICNTVNVIHRRDEFRADKKLIDEVNKKDNIKLYLNSEISKIIGNERFEGILLKDNRVIDCNALFEYVGFIPSTKFLDNLNICDEKGFIKVNSNFETKIKGIYAIGDCIDKNVRQIATAVGDGAIASTMISKSIGE